MKNQISIIKNNIVGAGLGGFAGYLAAKKAGGYSLTWTVLITAITAVAGAHIQAAMTAKKGAIDSANTAKK